jgi:hypothetical protein
LTYRIFDRHVECLSNCKHRPFPIQDCCVKKTPLRVRVEIGVQKWEGKRYKYRELVMKETDRYTLVKRLFLCCRINVAHTIIFVRRFPRFEPQSVCRWISLCTTYPFCTAFQQAYYRVLIIRLFLYSALGRLKIDSH